MRTTPLRLLFTLAALSVSVSGKAHAQPPQLFDYSKLKLVEEIDCSAEPDKANFRQFPEKASKVETILGKKTRVLENDSDTMKYFAYNIGKGKGLKPGAGYVLVVDYPEDKPRSMFILNRGNETGRGLSTGNAVGDNVFGRYVNNNAESLKYPLSGESQSWQTFFYLHDRFPEFESLRGAMPRPVKPSEGFWVVIAQVNKTDAADSAGAAASAIRLYEVPNPEQYNVKINYPPAELPKRYLFCREEMADGVISTPHGKDDPSKRGVDNIVDWYDFKARNMLFLGMNTFTKDLLEFGHNQGWDAKDDSWYVASSTPKLWDDIIAMLNKEHPSLYVLPYYEYGGSTGPKGIGSQHRPKMLNGGGDKYLPVNGLDWLNKNAHIDILDPDALADAKKMLDLTILKFKGNTKFAGAWFRPRPVQMPISFTDANLALYNKETKRSVKQADLQKKPEELQKYYDWWFPKRQAFVAALGAYLRSNGIAGADLIFTVDPSEPGVSLPVDAVVTDDTATWNRLMGSLPKKKQVLDFDSVVKNQMHLKAMMTPAPTYENWEWQHAMPWADPANYKKPGAVLTYTFNRLYTVSDAKSFDEFRSGDGLAIVRHYSLNENTMDDKIGYFACDMEDAGPYSMLADARAVAYGDPRYIGYLISNTLAPGFPQYTREFNRAFLALPALPSQIVANAANDNDVVVRVIDAGKHGTYMAVVNVGFESKKSVEVKLPKGTTLLNAATGEPIKVSGPSVSLDFYPGQLYALQVK